MNINIVGLLEYKYWIYNIFIYIYIYDIGTYVLYYLYIHILYPRRSCKISENQNENKLSCISFTSYFGQILQYASRESPSLACRPPCIWSCIAWSLVACDDQRGGASNLIPPETRETRSYLGWTKETDRFGWHGACGIWERKKKGVRGVTESSSKAYAAVRRHLPGGGLFFACEDRR